METRKEYIERGALRDGFLKAKSENTHHTVEARLFHVQEHNHLLNLLDNAPAADVVEVVRCGECAKYQIIKTQTGTIAGCRRTGFTSCDPDDYCSFGKRKDGATDNNVGSKIDGSDERPGWQQSMLRTFGGDADV